MSANTDKIAQYMKDHQASNGDWPDQAAVVTGTGLAPNVVAICMAQMKRFGRLPGVRKPRVKVAAIKKPRKRSKPNGHAATTNGHTVSAPTLTNTFKAKVLAIMYEELATIDDAKRAVEAGIAALTS